MRRAFALALAAFAAVLGSGSRIDAAPITFNYGTVVTGGTPSGPAPWLTATVTDVVGGVNIKLTAAGTLGVGEFVSKVYFNIFGFSPTGLNSIFNSGPMGTPSFSALPPNAPGPAGGNEFTLIVGFPTPNSPPGNRFEAGEVADLTLLGVTTADFLANSKGFTTVAHFQGLLGPGDDSGWVGNGGPGPGTGGEVPEPTTLAVCGVLAALGVVGYRRRRAAVAA